MGRGAGPVRRGRRRATSERYGGNVDLPAYNLAAARLGEERRVATCRWPGLARVGLLLVLTWLSRCPGAGAAGPRTLVRGTATLAGR